MVTGANRGLGREIAVAMAAAGAHVALVARERASLTATEDAVARHGADTLTVECDVTSPDATAAMAREALDHFGRVDAVVASAGIAGPTTPMHEMPYEAWRECLATDLDGVFLTLRDFIPPMIQAGAGSLIAISSITGKRPLAGRTPYAAAKMGVIGLMRTLALEVGPHGIRANSVCPGAVEGPRMRGVIAAQATRIGITPEEAAREFTDPAPLGRLVEPGEVAAACVFLASDAAAGITGEDLNVSAGLVMY